MENSIQFVPVGDCGVLAVCGDAIDEAVNARVMALDRAGQDARLPGVTETVPTYAALLVCYDPLQTDPDTLTPALQRLAGELTRAQNPAAAGRLVEVPVCYGGAYGPDLAGLDERLCCPRLQTPRTRIPAGSVGIGGEQTGIYPLDSPGGWQLIGRTPLRLFTPASGGQLPYAAGDRIRFVPITPEQFRAIEARQGGGV